MKIVRAGLRDDVQGGAGGPAEFGRERIREHVDFLYSAERHGGYGSLATPPFIIVSAVERHGCLAASADARDEVCLVDEEIARALCLPECRIQKRER